MGWMSGWLSPVSERYTAPMKTEIMTGGEAIVAALQDHKVDTLFGLPGAQIYGLFDGLAKAANGIRTIGARHEQGVAYMAFGYAKATGKPGVYAVVPGPGMLNTSAALLTAYGATAPVLCLTGQVSSNFINRERGALHEMRDQLGVMQRLTKWAGRMEHPSEAPHLVARAFQEMTSGRQGPAAIEAPWDFFTKTAPVTRMHPLAPIPKPEPDPDAVKAAAALLKDARAPMIFVGGGALEAGESITLLAEALEAPVVSFRSGRGIVDDRHPLGFSIAPGGQLWPETDVAVVIGTRFELLDMRWRWAPPGLKIIRIDIDPGEMRRLSSDVAIVADSDDGTRALLAAVLKAGGQRTGRADHIAQAKAKGLKAVEAIQPQAAYLQVIRDVLPDDGLVVDEISQVGFTSWYGFPVYAPRTFIASGYQGTLGSGFPTALGVKAAWPDRAVVSITGDGGFMFGVQELATAVQYGLNLVTIVFNNNAFGNVRRDQIQGFDGRLIGSELVNPDFVKLAEAFGMAGHRVTSPEGLRPVLEHALAAGAPSLIEVVVERGSETSPWAFIHPNFG